MMKTRINSPAIEETKITNLSSDKAIPKILENQKKTKEKVFILFISLWGYASTKLIETIEDAYVKKNKIYVVNSFDCPKSFTSHGAILFGRITSEPYLLRVSGNGNVKHFDYVPDIYSALGL